MEATRNLYLACEITDGDGVIKMPTHFVRSSFYMLRFTNMAMIQISEVIWET